ncbi:MAG: HDOD domain-containing protein [Gammaproteobacteria bacterium]
MSDIYLARQPIYDRDLNVYAYELLFRNNKTNQAGIVDGDQATADVIVNTFMEIGLNNIVGDRLAFINLTRSFIVDERPVSLPKDRVVLELLEDIDPDEEVIQAARRFTKEGYTLALDDFIFHESLRPLVEIASIIKIDVMALDQQQIREHVTELRQYPLKLLAEKIESQAMYRYCVELGFDYFQGYFFAQPVIIQGQRLPNNRLAILRLLGRLQDASISAKQLEELVSQDVALSFRILRYINSASLSLPRKVESIHEAVVLVGLQNIKNWSLLLAMSSVDNKPVELVTMAMIRGKMAELLATKMDLANPESFFTVGLFSALDALVDNSMEEILTQLPLADHIAKALLHHEGTHGDILNCVLTYERGDWEAISCNMLSMPEIRTCYLEALKWAGQMRQQLVQS